MLDPSIKHKILLTLSIQKSVSNCTYEHQSIAINGATFQTRGQQQTVGVKNNSYLRNKLWGYG